MKRIGFDAKRFYHSNTGLGNYSRNLIRQLSKYFPENEYVLYNPKPKKIDVQINQKNTSEQMPLGYLNSKLPTYWRMQSICKQLEKDKIDIYHGLSGKLPSGLQRTKIKKIVTIHDLIFIRFPKLYDYTFRKIHYLQFKKACEIADIIVAISEQTKRDIIKFYNIPESKIRVIYQGCNALYKHRFSEEFKNKILRKYNLKLNFILNVGTVEARKNVFTLIKAIKDIDTNLVIVGGLTSYYKKIKTYVSDNNMSNKVTFLQNVPFEDLAILYQLAKIFVYPSIFEGFGIPIIEAIYSKVPVITSKNSCFPEAGGPYSLYTDSYDADMIKRYIEMLLNNPEIAKEQIEESYKFVQKFNDDIIASAYAKVYEELSS